MRSDDAAAVKPATPPATRQDLFRFLEDLGIETSTVDHPAVFTVAESAKIERQIPGGHTKNLFLKDAKGILFLVIAEADTAVDLKALSKRAGAGRFSFGRAELLLDVLGVTPGSVTAFALMNDGLGRVRVIVDSRLMRHDQINCHPLENTATTTITRESLMRFIAETGHSAEIIDLEA